MATVTPVNRPRGQTRGGVAAVLDYVTQEKKTEYEGRRLVTGINCQVETCCTEFISTKLQYNKCGGKMYFHFVQSFHPDENITPEEAHTVALELAQQWKDYEVVVATHVDAAHIHSHLVINSVSFETGRKLHFEKDDLTQLRKFSDEICMRHGLSICQPKKHQTSGIRQSEYHSAMRGESWKVALAIQIDECMKYAVNKDQFIELMESEGYQVKWTDSRKNITYTTPDGKSCRDYRLHDEKYLKENMQYEFYIREKQYTTHYGRAASHAEDCTESEHRQGRKHPEGSHADGGELDRSDRSSGADRTSSSQAAGVYGATSLRRADGLDAQSTSTAHDGRTPHSDLRDAESSARAEREQHSSLGADAKFYDGESEHNASRADGDAEEVRETGWENQREILFRTLRGDDFHEALRQSYTVAAVPADHSIGAVGIGAASVLAGLTVMDSDSDDPEERRRKMEAKVAAQNLGAAIGLVAGTVIIANNLKNNSEPETTDVVEQASEQTM